jgi:hypothetical protein
MGVGVAAPWGFLAAEVSAVEEFGLEGFVGAAVFEQVLCEFVF